MTRNIDSTIIGAQYSRVQTKHYQQGYGVIVIIKLLVSLDYWLIAYFFGKSITATKVICQRFTESNIQNLIDSTIKKCNFTP